MVKVYIVERGCYSDRHVASVHSSVERAIAHYPGETWRPFVDCSGWQNTKDWGDLLEINVFELDEKPYDVGQSELIVRQQVAARVNRAFGLDEEQSEPNPFKITIKATIPLQEEAR